MVASALALLATAAVSTPGRGQPREGLADCGARPPLRYAAVFDASSSVRGDPALRADTEARYGELLGLLTGLLCTGDRLAVYTFAADGTTRMDPLVEITPSSRTPSLLSEAARRVIEARSSHTDLHLVTRGIVRDVIPGMEPDAVFLVTDGSFYPFRPTPHDRTLAGVRNRLTELAAFVADSVRPESSGVFVIGVNAANSYAVDRQLGVALPAASSQRRWKDVDLLEDHGEDLLAAVFGTRYIALSELSLWDVLVGLPQSVWARRLDYLTDRDLPWNEVSTLSVQHLVYVPGGPGGSSSCTPPSARGAPARVEQAGYAVDGGILCSLSHPTTAQMAAIHQSSRFYAFRQATSLRPDTGTRHVRGLHDVVLRDSADECSGRSVRGHFGSGDRWPPPAPHVGELRISPTGEIRWSDPIRLIRLGGAGCVVPRFTSGEWPYPPGEYFVKVAHAKTSVFRVTVEPARSAVVEAFIRPGGLPFPSDRIALVRVCVRTRPALSGHERMWMRLEGKLFPLTPERAHRCAGATPDVAAFSGLVGLEHTDRGSAEVFVVSESHNPDSPQDGEWMAVTLRRDGKLFQSWTHLCFWFLVGVAVQLAYACVANRRFHPGRLARFATLTGAVISGIIVAVVAQFVVTLRETDVDSDKIPVIFALAVLAHMAKLLAAALVPEHVEEVLLTE